MLVHVTADDIALGCRRAATNCPVARAVLRATGAEYVTVDHRYISIYAVPAGHGMFTDPIKQWDTPLRVEQAIDSFDDNAGMYPFTFEL
jgi:hypothetical protein